MHIVIKNRVRAAFSPRVYRVRACLCFYFFLFCFFVFCFRVDSEEDLYRLWVEGYQGNATDSLGSHNGYAFSTFDRDNDEAPVSRSLSLSPIDYRLV